MTKPLHTFSLSQWPFHNCNHPSLTFDQSPLIPETIRSQSLLPLMKQSIGFVKQEVKRQKSKEMWRLKSRYLWTRKSQRCWRKVKNTFKGILAYLSWTSVRKRLIFCFIFNSSYEIPKLNLKKKLHIKEMKSVMDEWGLMVSLKYFAPLLHLLVRTVATVL